MSLKQKLSLLARIEKALLYRAMKAQRPKLHRTVRSLSEADARDVDILKMRNSYYREKNAIRKQKQQQDFIAD